MPWNKKIPLSLVFDTPLKNESRDTCTCTYTYSRLLHIIFCIFNLLTLHFSKTFTRGTLTYKLIHFALFSKFKFQYDSHYIVLKLILISIPYQSCSLRFMEPHVSLAVMPGMRVSFCFFSIWNATRKGKAWLIKSPIYCSMENYIDISTKIFWSISIHLRVISTLNFLSMLLKTNDCLIEIFVVILIENWHFQQGNT